MIPENIRALLFVLVLAIPAFYVSSQLASSIVSRREFAVWRNVWFALTAAAFLSGNFFVFAALLTVICLFVRAVGGASLAIFFVMLFAAPLTRVEVGGFGFMNNFIELSNARVLAIFLLVPLLIANGAFLRRNGDTYAMPDRIIICYVVLMIGLEFRRSEVTNVMRVATLYALDVLIPYFAFSRVVTSMADLRKISLGFVIAVLPLSLIAVLEMAKGWHLYAVVAENLGADAGAYSRRSGMLRASASAIDLIVFGFISIVAIGSALAIRPTIASRRYMEIALALLTAGLVASLSRGPWVGAAILLVVFLATGPNVAPNLVLLAVAGCVIVAPLLLTPFGEQLLDFLPFVGTIDATSVEYRQQLFENAMQVIERNLWFGSADFLQTNEMQEMMQGQGIIDMVNSYLYVALYAGLVGLCLFAGFFAAILFGLRRVLKLRGVLVINSIYARASLATLIAVLATIATVSSINFIPSIYWSFAGLCVALIRIADRERAVTVRIARASHAVG